MTTKDFHKGVSYDEGGEGGVREVLRTEWVCDSDNSKKESHFSGWIRRGEKLLPLTLEALRSLPPDPFESKSIELYKGDSQLISWKKRYCVVKGGMISYFVNSSTSKPQGIIPLQDCAIDLPNDNRKSFAMKGRPGVDGYEIRISHHTRRPFILVFATHGEREEWRLYLSGYIAHAFLGKEYHYGKIIFKVDEGCLMTKRHGKAGKNGTHDILPQFKSQQRWLYVDWHSSNSSLWGLRYASNPILVMDSVEQKVAVGLNTEKSKIILFSSIESILLDPEPSASFRIYERALSANDPGDVWQFAVVSGEREEAVNWVNAIEACRSLIAFFTNSGASSPSSTRNIAELRRHMMMSSGVISSNHDESYHRATFIHQEKLISAYQKSLEQSKKQEVNVSQEERASEDEQLDSSEDSKENEKNHKLETRPKSIELKKDSKESNSDDEKVHTVRRLSSDKLQQVDRKYSSDSGGVVNNSPKADQQNEGSNGNAIRRQSSIGPNQGGKGAKPRQSILESLGETLGFGGRRLSFHKKEEEEDINRNSASLQALNISSVDKLTAADPEKPLSQQRQSSEYKLPTSLGNQKRPITMIPRNQRSNTVSNDDRPSPNQQSQHYKFVDPREVLPSKHVDKEATKRRSKSAAPSVLQRSTTHQDMDDIYPETTDDDSVTYLKCEEHLLLKMEYKGAGFFVYIDDKSNKLLVITAASQPADCTTTFSLLQGNHEEISLANYVDSEVDMNGTGFVKLTMKDGVKGENYPWIFRSSEGMTKAVEWLNYLDERKDMNQNQIQQSGELL